MLIAVAVAVGACSFTMNRPRGKADPSRVPDCSRSKFAPQVDIIVPLILLPLAGLITLMNSGACEHPDSGCNENNPENLTVPLVTIGLTELLVAAPIGYMWANECRKRHRDHARWMREQNSATSPNTP